MPTRNTFLLLTVLILLAAASRLLPHWPNFTPIGAMALFGAATFPRKWMAWMVPLIALYLSDLALNNVLYAEYYEGFYWGFNSWVYLGFAISIVIGLGVLRASDFSWLKLGGAVLGSTAVFFLLTNFGSWLGSAYYPQTWSGLVAAFVAGLPFLINSVAGNIFFCALMFGGARVFAPKALAVAQRS